MSTAPDAWTPVSPSGLAPRTRRGLSTLAAALGAAGGVAQEIDELLESFLDAVASWPLKDQQRARALARVLADVSRQGWGLRVQAAGIEVRLPTEIDADPAAEKERVRRQEQLKRDEQLRQPAVQAFLRAMERRRLFQGRFVSIFSVIRDGRALAEALRRARAARAGSDAEPLTEVIAPYLQFVSPGERCDHTGLDLQDIWRYFRHTWTTQYTSVPGRSMMLLVRDSAAEFHPVIGIAALSSPIVQIKERDEWIGWHPDRFLEAVGANPTARIARWLTRVVDKALTEVYVDDLVRDRVVTLKALRAPTPATIAALEALGGEQRGLHHRYVKAKEVKSARPVRAGVDADAHWVERACNHLFRSKRALALAELLSARAVLRQHLGARPTARGLSALLADTDGRQTVKRVLRKAKAERVGIAMADISVCGAVAPYNHVLGGKLVSMLATSPEVVRAYRDRYARAESEIASSVAGRAIVRPPNLVFLGTTSLYGVGASQYNRVKIPCEVLGGEAGEAIEYTRLGMSEAFGTSQYSDETLDDLALLVNQLNDGQRVNSIFGEGVSPKLRKVREGLELLGLPSELFLRHGRRRILYGITLVRNTRDYLLGLDGRPAYLIPEARWPEASRRIAAWWTTRWLKHRVLSDAVLEDVARHRLVHPITHGARVVVPARDEAQVSMAFDAYENAAR